MRTDSTIRSAGEPGAADRVGDGDGRRRAVEKQDDLVAGNQDQLETFGRDVRG
jgi:hypothetical protein